MKKHLLSIFSVIFFSSPAFGQDLRNEMDSVYSAYKDLQKYLYDEDAFENVKNQKVISKDLFLLSNSFHKIDKLDTPYKNAPGFEATLKIIHEVLEDSYLSFNKGRKSYAQWQLRGISNHCATCHFSHNIKLKFEDELVKTNNLPSIATGNFFYSTRQFDKAADIFLKIARNSKENFNAMTALRRWLIVETRANTDSKKSYETLEGILKTVKFPSYEEAELTRWLNSLKEWSDAPRSLATFEEIDRVIRQSISIDPRIEEGDEVTLLKATAALHAMLPSLKDEERARALLNLGMSYAKLDLFFIDELPQVYLELAIEESPGSTNAKAAYHIYQNLIEQEFTGSSGTNIPSDVKLKLIELWNKAYDIKTLSKNN